MGKILKISYTKLSFYLTCPRRYYYRYEEKRPFYPTKKIKYGSNIHRVLKDYSELLKVGEIPNKQARQSLFNNQWTKISKNKEEDQQFKDQGLEQLEKFAEINEKSAQNILFLEKSFNFPITHDISINGYIDRIDKIEDNCVDIIDYKTGNTRQLFEDDIQLNLYALVCRYLGLEPKKLSLYFVQFNKKTSVDVQDKYIDEVKNLILNTAGKIKNKEFKPGQVIEKICDECSYKRICPDYKDFIFNLYKYNNKK